MFKATSSVNLHFRVSGNRFYEATHGLQLKQEFFFLRDALSLEGRHEITRRRDYLCTTSRHEKLFENRSKTIRSRSKFESLTIHNKIRNTRYICNEVRRNSDDFYDVILSFVKIARLRMRAMEFEIIRTSFQETVRSKFENLTIVNEIQSARFISATKQEEIPTVFLRFCSLLC